MNKSVWIETLPGGYSVRYYKEVSPGVSRKQREWFKEYNLAQKRKAELRLKLLAQQQGVIDPTLKPSHCFESYIASLEHTHREATLGLKRGAIEKFVATLSSFENLTPKIKLWRDEMIRDAYNVNTVRIRLREFKVFINWCIKEGYVKESPFKGVEFPAAKEVGRRLELDEMKALFASADTSFKPYMLFLIYTGARRSEILKTEWQDIDFKTKTWVIPKDNTKSKKERTVPLADPVIAALTELSRKPGRVFPSFTTHNIHHALRMAAKRAGILGRLRIHDFRHSFVSHWRGDPRIVAEVVGWNGLGMLKRYSHFNLRTIRSTMEQSSVGAELGQIGAYPPKSSSSLDLSQTCNKNVTSPLPPSEKEIPGSPNP